MENYLITFKSTTATFKASKLIKEKFPLVDMTQEIIPVPFRLSDTCYGLGIRCSAEKKDMESLFFGFKDNAIDFKRFWAVDDDYVPIDFGKEQV